MPDVLRLASVAPQPWRNGGGSTRQIAVQHTGDQLDWRLSIAEVSSSGPFSAFPGVDRTLVLFAGPAMRLTVDGVRHEVRPQEPLAFSGDAETRSEIEAPTRDLNVMTRRGAWTADVRVIPLPDELVADDRDITFAVVLDGGAVLAPSGTELRPGDVLRPAPGEVSRFTGTGSLAVVRIRQQGASAPARGRSQDDQSSRSTIARARADNGPGVCR